MIRSFKQIYITFICNNIIYNYKTHSIRKASQTQYHMYVIEASGSIHDQVIQVKNQFRTTSIVDLCNFIIRVR